MACSFRLILHLIESIERLLVNIEYGHVSADKIFELLA